MSRRLAIVLVWVFIALHRGVISDIFKIVFPLHSICALLWV
jgi:hypothetical protein